MSEPRSEPTKQSNKYQMIAELGHGGMADVYLAVLSQMKGFRKLAVVKRLRPHLAEDPDFLAMFLQEARIAARLNHPNVVQTFEVGNDGRHHFIAMEYLEGQAYSAVIARVGREQFDLALQIRILIEALEGLSYAHDLKDFDGTQMGLVHRDISPQNVFLTYDGTVKILDFGIAKAFDSAVETRAGVVKGKLAYMSPEQALGMSVDRRSDLFSVGVLLWEAVAERRRFKGLPNVQIMKEIVASEQHLELPPIEGRGLPRLLTKILSRSMAFDPAKRYLTALDFQTDLEKLLEEMGRRVATRDVGRFVADRFADDRKLLEGVVDGEMKRLDSSGIPSHTGDIIRIDMPEASFTPTLESQGMRGAGPISTGAPAVTIVESSADVSVSQELARAPPKRRRRAGAWIGLMLGLLSIAAVLAFVFRAQLFSRALAGGAPPEPSTAPSAAAGKSDVHIRLSAVPASAVLYLNGRRLGPNPYEGSLPRSDGTAEVRAESQGHETETRTVKLESDVDLEITLKPSSATAPSAAPSSKPHVAQHWPLPTSKTGATAPEATTAKPASTAPEMKPPSPRPKAGVVLDTDNPWKK